MLEESAQMFIQSDNTAVILGCFASTMFPPITPTFSPLIWNVSLITRKFYSLLSGWQCFYMILPQRNMRLTLLCVDFHAKLSAVLVRTSVL